MELFLIIISIIIFLFLAFCFTAALIMTNKIVNPKFKSREERNKTNLEDGFLKGTERYNRETFQFIMSDGYVINGDISINDNKKFIIFCHGHASNREGSIKFTKIFYDLGYSLVLYDHRAHGDNERRHLTMGAQESKDLAEIVKILKNKYGNDIEIGVFGYSMGAATVCLGSKYFQDDVKFIISDCAYSSLKSECHNQCIVYKIPFIPTILFMQLFFKIKYHLSFKDCDVKKAVEINKLPICFFHGSEDRTVFVSNLKTLFDASGSKCKECHCFENAGHTECIEVNYELYKTIINEFLNKIGD